MEIIVLSIIAGLVTIGGLWVATRGTEPADKQSGSQDHEV